jgi:hypothetical protein
VFSNSVPEQELRRESTISLTTSRAGNIKIALSRITVVFPSHCVSLVSQIAVHRKCHTPLVSHSSRNSKEPLKYTASDRMSDKRTLRSGFTYDSSKTRAKSMSVRHSPKDGNGQRNGEREEDEGAQQHDTSLIELEDGGHSGRKDNDNHMEEQKKGETTVNLERRFAEASISGIQPMPTITSHMQVPNEHMYFPANMSNMSRMPPYRNYTGYRVKLRKFKSGGNVRAWFEIAESEFHEWNTSEADKFAALISSLDDDVYDSMSNSIAGLPPTNRYASLKALLIEHYSLSRGQELRKLLSGLSIKDKKPSRLLAEMRSLAGHGRFTDEDLKTLFLEYIPSDVRMTLQVVPGDVNALATVADKIMEHRPAEKQEVAAIKKTEDDTASMLAKLLKRLDRMEARFESRSRSRSRSRTSSRSRASSKDSSRSQSPEEKICFYHRRFKAKARKCAEPCNWADKKQVKPAEN